MTPAKSTPNIFADTSGWAQLVDVSQTYHLLTATIYRSLRQKRHRLVTTNYILTELVALLTSPLRRPRNDIITFIDGIQSSPYVEIIHIDQSLHNLSGACLPKDLTKCGVW